MSGADTAVVVADDGAGVESADGGESALCSFERVSDKENEDDLPLDSLLPGPPEHHEQASGQASGAGEDSSSSSDSESESSSESDVLTDTDHKEASRVIGIPSPAEGTRFLVHRSTKMLHMIADGNSRVMLCGRLVQEVHQETPEVRFDSSVCSMCKRAASNL